MPVLNPPTDNTDISAWKKYFADENIDELVYQIIDNLRTEVEPLDKWNTTKQKAQKELDEVSPHILGKLLKQFSPFITHLPAGHGPGHLSRDLIHLTILLGDLYIQQQDAVEIFVGIIAGIFHDIGNAVVERYDESLHFAGHAEVGAYLFGELSQNLIPLHLRRLIQFAIASHTNYLKDLAITKYSGTIHEKTLIRKPYNNTPIKEKQTTQKISLWMTQATDRSDALGVPFITRHIITKAVPTRDFAHGEFHVIADTEEEDFIHQFMPIIRTQEYKRQLINKKDKTSIVLEHFNTYYETTVDRSPYSQHDTPHFFSYVVATNALDTARFIIATTAKAETLTPQERNDNLERFYSLCAILEPAHNTKKTVQLLQKKFQLLSESYQNHWAHGFALLINKLYPRWYEETKKYLEETPKFTNQSLTSLVRDLKNRALAVNEAFSPMWIDKKEKPDLLHILLNAYK